MRRTAFLALAIALLAVACGDGGSDTGPEAPDAAEQEANAVDITMQDYAFAVDGEATAGPLTLMFHNEGEDIHHGIVGQLTDGKTIEDVQALLDKGLDGPPPPWFDDTPLDMTLISPGESAGVTFDAKEGTYVLLCFMPGPDNKPHFAHGMAESFEVGPAADATDPEPDATVSMTEDGIEAPEGLSSGSSVVEVVNDGKIDMETFVIDLAEGKSPEDVDAWFNSGQKGPSPATFYGGTHTFPPGESALLSFDLEPGDYSIVATYEGKDGKPVDIPQEFTVEG